MKYKLIAGTEIGHRANNEDNFAVCSDLAQNTWIVPVNANAVLCDTGRGCALVVADGMGGQNAGEVASSIAVQTIQSAFNAMDAAVPHDEAGIRRFLKQMVRKADGRVKEHERRNPESMGMGTTVVIAWLVNDKVYVAWVGDSRAYSFVPGKGIGRITKDHSWVQRLVDNGELTEIEAMNHPNSNVITRSIGDPKGRVQPDVVSKVLETGEIIMLCTDGLCGVMTDQQIGTILESEYDDLIACKDKLISAALSAGGTDNITVALVRLCEKNVTHPRSKSLNKKTWAFLSALVLCVFLGMAAYKILCPRLHPRLSQPESVENVDTPLIKPRPDKRPHAVTIKSDAQEVNTGSVPAENVSESPKTATKSNNDTAKSNAVPVAKPTKSVRINNVSDDGSTQVSEAWKDKENNK